MSVLVWSPVPYLCEVNLLPATAPANNKSNNNNKKEMENRTSVEVRATVSLDCTDHFAEVIERRSHN